MSFNEHKVLLCLDRELYMAFIRLQADKGLGRSYAGLIPYIEGLYKMGYLSKECYEAHLEKYSVPLVAHPEAVTCGFKGCSNEAIGLAFHQLKKQKFAYCVEHEAIVLSNGLVWKVMK